jgi:hypothetical protein
VNDQKTTTVLDLLRDIDAARDRMSVSNPNKALLHRCGAAVIELARKAHAMDVQHLATPEQVAAIMEGVPV